MSHLIGHAEGSLRDVQAEIEEAHRALVGVAKDMARQLEHLPAGEWGVRAKRVHVDGQPLSELTNQLASVERLLDAIDWVAQRQPDDVRISVNPTTSSVGNDLMVFGAETWIFEVSDVAGRKNTNRKLDKDVATLLETSREYPGGRYFLVVSEEWADWLTDARRAFWERRQVLAPTPDRVHTRVGSRGTGIVELVPDRPANGQVGDR